MMRCSQVQRQLAQYADDLLDSRKREAVEAHLRDCEGCRAALRDVTAAASALRGLKMVRPPASFAPRVRAAVRAQAEAALRVPLLSPDLRAALSGAFFMIVLGLLATHYLAPARSYVASAPTTTVALRAASAEFPPPAPRAAARTPGRKETGENRASVRPPARFPGYRPGIAHNANAILGPAPSTDHLAPKAREAEPGSRAPTVASAASVGRASAPGPAPARPVTQPAVLTDEVAGPRLTETGAGAVATPIADRPSAWGSPGEPHVGLVAASGSPGAGTAGADSGEASAAFGFEDLFNESSLPRYADVS